MMKAVKNQDMNELTKQIWSSFNIIRGNIPASDFHVVLFLLSVYRDEVIELPKFNNPFALHDYLDTEVRKNEIYSEIWEVYFPIIQKIPAPQLGDLFYSLSRIDKRLLTKQFKDVFEELLFLTSDFQGKHYGEIVQPNEISRLIINLAGLKGSDKVYNPFAGLGSYNLFLNDSQSYYGQEYNRDTWALGMLRMFANGKILNTTYVQEDSIEQWKDNDKFDLIVSSPPLRLPISSEFRAILTDEPYRRIESFLIDKGIHSLNKSGKLISLVPLSFLFGMGVSERKLKESLVNNDLLDSVISLPQNLLKNTGISLCIVIIKIAAARPGFVKFINGSNFFIKGNGKVRNNILRDSDLIEVISQDKENDILKYVPVENIEANDYDLSVPRYFVEEFAGEKIGSFSSIIRGSMPEENSSGIFIKIRDLKEDLLDYNLNTASIEGSKVSIPGVRKIEESCLLLATRWKTLKPTYFQYTGKAIFIRPDIVALTLDENRVDVDYLINELYSEYVSEQLFAIRTGSTIPMVRKRDLMNVKIKFPSSLDDAEAKKKQKELAVTVKEPLRKARLKEAGLLRDLEDFKKSYKEELESKQHNIRQHLKNVNDSVTVLMRFMALNQGVLKADAVINRKRNITVDRRFNALKDSLDQVIFEINNITNELKFEPATRIPLIKTIRACIDEQGGLENFNFEFDPDEVALQEAKIKDPEISFSKSAFKEVFNNIIENAKRHGFKESNENYIIEISLTIQDSSVILEFLNNGLPWPKGVVAKLGTKGVKAGVSGNKGIGIWRIFQTVKNYGGEYEIVDQPQETFPVGFKFKFEIKENSK